MSRRLINNVSLYLTFHVVHCDINVVLSLLKINAQGNDDCEHLEPIVRFYLEGIFLPIIGTVGIIGTYSSSGRSYFKLRCRVTMLDASLYYELDLKMILICKP